MARKKKHAEHVNHERWLVSYADFITLLFAFFVVMFATSQVDAKKVGRFTESFSKAVGIQAFEHSGNTLMPDGTLEPQERKEGDHSDKEKDDLEEHQETLTSVRSALAGDEGTGGTLEGLQVLQRDDDLVLRLQDNIVFPSGDDVIQPRAIAVLKRIVKEVQDRPINVRVEGHTDNRPIHNFRFRSNWELSTARATSVVALLAAEGFGPERLSAAGYGEFHPITTNASDEGRAQNRRVDLVLSVPRKAELPQKKVLP